MIMPWKGSDLKLVPGTASRRSAVPFREGGCRPSHQIMLQADGTTQYRYGGHEARHYLGGVSGRWLTPATSPPAGTDNRRPSPRSPQRVFFGNQRNLEGGTDRASAHAATAADLSSHLSSTITRSKAAWPARACALLRSSGSPARHGQRSSSPGSTTPSPTTMPIRSWPTRTASPSRRGRSVSPPRFDPRQVDLRPSRGMPRTAWRVFACRSCLPCRIPATSSS